MNVVSVLVSPAVAVGLTAVALVVRRLFLNRLAARLGRSDAESAELLQDGLRLPSLLWCVVLGLYGAVETAALPPRLDRNIGLLLQALVIGSVTMTAANVLAAVVARSGERRTLAVGVTGLAQTVVRATVVTVGGLILLGTLGVAITPILTALGIGGLAVALALQDALTNLFAGIHLLADKFIRVGEFVRLENGMEGSVEDIGWRSTRIRVPPDRTVVVPNAKLAQSIVTKLSRRPTAGLDESRQSSRRDEPRPRGAGARVS